MDVGGWFLESALFWGDIEGVLSRGSAHNPGQHCVERRDLPFCSGSLLTGEAGLSVNKSLFDLVWLRGLLINKPIGQ